MAQPLIHINDQLGLYPPESVHPPDLYEILTTQKAYLQQWLPWVNKLTTLEEVRDFLRDASRFNTGKQRFNTFIFCKDTLLGSIGLLVINRKHHIAEIGYWLRQDYQSKGIITKSCRHLMAYAFQQLQLNRLEIKVQSTNTRSLIIPRRLGFVHEATLRSCYFRDNQYFDMELFSFLKSEWKGL